jgi:hypothetical protein
MLSPFIPAASNASAKPADQAASHKPEAGTPAPGTSFQELLARKTNAPAKPSSAASHSQAQAHSQAQFHSKAQAQAQARANERAEVHTQSRPEAKSRDSAPAGPSATAKAARDAAEKPVDHSVNRRIARSDAKAHSNAADAKAETAAAAGQSNSSERLNPVVKSPADALADTTSEDASATEDPALPVLPAFGEQPQAVALPASPLTPVAPLTVGLPTAGVPAPEQSTDSAQTSEAALELATAEGNLQGSSATTGTPAGYAAAKARASQTAAAQSTANFSLSPAAAAGQKATAAETAAGAESTDGFASALPAGSATSSTAGTSVAPEGSTAAAAQADARQGATAYGLAAQIADTAKAGNPSAQDLAIGKIKNSDQAAEYKEDKKSSVGDGIRRAYELPSMSTTTPVFQAPTATVQTLGPVNANTPVAPTVASTALRMVEKVSEVAEHLASNPAEQVTVRIDLDATHRVDVHVSMRGGQVHADFRSDSADMRAALASAWNEFSQKREGTDRQWAAPVFSTLAAPAAASSITPAAQSSEASLSFSQGQDSANRQAAEREAQTQGIAKAIRPAANAAAPATADVKTPIVRSENSQHLSVLA